MTPTQEAFALVSHAIDRILDGSAKAPDAPPLWAAYQQDMLLALTELAARLLKDAELTAGDRVLLHLLRDCASA